MFGGGILLSLGVGVNTSPSIPSPIHRTYTTPETTSPSVTITSNMKPAYYGTNVTFKAHVQNFPGIVGCGIVYHYKWYLGTTLIPYATGSKILNITFLLGRPTDGVCVGGNPGIQVDVTNATGTCISATFTEDLYIPPSILISSNGPSDAGTTYEFRSYTDPLYPGISPYTQQWYENGTAIQGATGKDLNISFEHPGIYTMTVIWTDHTGNLTCHFNSTIKHTVDPVLGLAISASRNPSDIGQQIQFSALPSGSTKNYTSYSYKLYAGDSNLSSILYSGSTKTFSATVDSAGTFLVWYQVKSSTGNFMNATLSQVVNSDPTLAISANKTTTDVGNPIGLTLSPSGGTSPYSYAWFCRSSGGSYKEFSTGKSPSITFSQSGTYDILGQLIDGAGYTVNATAISITVDPPFSAYITSAQGHKVIICSNVCLTVHFIGGSGVSQAPTWSGTCGPLAHSGVCIIDDSVNLGRHVVTVKAKDTSGSVSIANYTLNVYSNNIKIFLHPPKYVPTGTLIDLNATVSPLFTPPRLSGITYTWTINGVSYSGNHVPYEFATVGTYHISLKVDAETSGVQITQGTKYNGDTNSTYTTVIASSPGRSTNIIINSAKTHISGGDAFSWYTTFHNSSSESYFVYIGGTGVAPSQVVTESNGTLLVVEDVYFSDYAPGTYNISLVVFNNKSQSNESVQSFSVSLDQSNAVTLNTIIQWFGGLTNFVVVVGTLAGVGGTFWAIHAADNPNVIIQEGTGKKARRVRLKGKKVKK